MSQIEVLNYLKKHSGKWYSAKRLTDILGLNSVAVSLKKLRNHGFIDYKEAKVRTNYQANRTCFYYRYKK